MHALGGRLGVGGLGKQLSFAPSIQARYLRQLRADTSLKPIPSLLDQARMRCRCRFNFIAQGSELQQGLGHRGMHWAVQLLPLSGLDPGKQRARQGSAFARL